MHVNLILMLVFSVCYTPSVPHHNRPHRNQLFTDNVNRVNNHNAKNTSWKLKINRFSNMSTDEFKKILGTRVRFIYTPEKEDPVISNLPKTIDWRKKGVVTPVKNQGMCGSCWAFSVAEGIESQYSILTRTNTSSKLIDLSIQEILDCNDICIGCNGCRVERAFNMVSDKGGLSSGWNYPYISFYGENFECKNAKIRHAVKISGYKVLPINSYYSLINALNNIGPIQVVVDSRTWSQYSSGIFDGCNKTHIRLNHAVQLVGIGFDNVTTLEYWIVRNTWGVNWGENGYIRLLKSSNYTCGMRNNNTVCGTCGIQYKGIYPIVVLT